MASIALNKMADTPILEKEFNQGLDVEGRIKSGGILARIFMEVQGTDEDAAKTALEKTIFENMNSERNVKLLEVKFYKINKDEEGEFYSGVVEVRLISDDFRWFVSLVMRYGPSAIDIIEPEEVHLNLDEMQSILADISEISQTYSSKIFSMMKDEERMELYKKMMGEK